MHVRGKLMARYEDKNGKSKKETKKDEPIFRFINCDLLAKDVEWLEACDCEKEFPAEMVEELVFEGYKYSIGYDARNQCCIASLTDRGDGSPYKNCCITGRGATPADARYALLYRHVVLAQGDWSLLDKGDQQKQFRFR